MSQTDDFSAAVTKIASAKPSQADQLKLYGLYKQATKGDTTDKRPGMTKIRDRAKFDAWSANSGTSKEDAMVSYAKLVNSLV